MNSRKALECLSAKLETLDGALKDHGHDDMVRILNSLFTQEEHEKVSAADKVTYGNRGDYDLI